MTDLSNIIIGKFYIIFRRVLDLKIKSRVQQITLIPNIIKVKILIANVSLFTIQHLQSNLNESTVQDDKQ
jgi:hypothetical protein